MLECFRRWKRTAGAVTLVMAFLFAAAWVKGFFADDELMFERFAMVPHEPGWFAGVLNTRYGIVLLVYGEATLSLQGISIPFLSGVVVTAPVLCTPHWSVVIPLTCMSAWLLLSKRRQPTRPEPAQEMAA